MGAVPPLVGVAVKVTLVPEQIVPEGDDAIVTDAVPEDGVVGVSVLRFEEVDSPVIVPEIEDGLILPATDVVLVACTCSPVIEN
jgi:hypothetical protein